MSNVFVGRSRELALLDAASRHSLVTLWGTGGVGKTRLAREHAAQQHARGRAVVWADLSSARTRREAIATLALALGVTLDGAEDEPLDALVRAASAQRALVVADNLEQLDADARSVVARLAEEAAGARVLVTSRERLGAAHEHVVAVEPLGDEDGVLLFEALAGPLSGAGSTTRAIVRRLDALPLAIELAAARVPLLGVHELLARLDRKLDVLRAPSSAAGGVRHATLRAAIAWSWELLDDDERDALMACATFEAPFDAALAEAVIGGTEARALELLERLRGRALVHAALDHDGRSTLRLLESVRDFAREGSLGRAEPAASLLSRSHAAAIVGRAEPLAEAADCGRDVLADLERLRADLVCAASAPGPLGARATLALASLIAVSGPATAALGHIDAALACDPAPPLAARLSVARGVALRALGRLADAGQALEGAQDAVRALEPGSEAALLEAESARVLGSVWRALGRTVEALSHLERALAGYRALGEQARAGLCLGEIGAVHQSEGRLALARARHAEAIAIHVAMHSRRAEGVDRSYLAVATHRAGHMNESLALHEAALAIHREAGHRRLEGAELLHLGFVQHELAAIPAARAALSAARGVLASSGASGLVALALIFAARLEADEGDATSALVLLAEASLASPARWPRALATHRLVSGHLAMTSGDLEGARAFYESALLASEDREVGFEALTPAYLAVATARLGRTPDAALLDDARARVETLENPHLRVAFALLAARATVAPLPSVPAEAARASSDVRRALVFVGARRALAVEDDGRRLVLPDGRAIDLSRRKNVRLVLLALARARHASPGVALLPDALLEAGWPGERMRADAGTKRLHTAIWTLRSLGLEGLLLTQGEGYMLDPRIELALGSDFERL